MTIVAVTGQRFPAVQGIVNGPGGIGFLRELPQSLFEPLLQRFQQWFAALVANRTPFLGGTSADLFLDGIQSREPFQRFFCHRRFVRLVQIEKWSTRMRHTHGLVHSSTLLSRSPAQTRLQKWQAPLGS